MTIITADERGEVHLTRPPDQRGELQILTSVLDGRIIVDFGRAVRWVGLTSEQAQKLADDLLGAVRSARTLHVPPGD